MNPFAASSGHRARVLFLGGLVLTGCATTARPDFTYPQRAALPALPGARPIEVGEVVNKVYTFATVGRRDSGMSCSRDRVIQWGSKLDGEVSHLVKLVKHDDDEALIPYTSLTSMMLDKMLKELDNAISSDPVERLAETQEVSRVLRDELHKAGYQVPGSSGARAGGPADARPPLILRPTLNNVAISACDNSKGFTSWSSVTIEWELYDPNTKSAIFTTTTGGTARSPHRGSYLESYAAALRNLLSEPGFTTAARSALEPSRDTVYPALSLKVVTVSPDPARSGQLLKQAARAVVRIVKGAEEGSGVIVSASGQVLTAAYFLAGPSGPIDVVLADGQRVRVTVLRTSSAAGVALIELPRSTYPYPVMPVGAPSELKPQGEVFAIGPPAQEKRDRRVTKGVIVSLRTGEERTVIQSDVIMHSDSSGGPLLDKHGRLIGIAIGRVRAGQNTFLGIEDTWRALQIQPQVATVDADALTSPGSPSE